MNKVLYKKLLHADFNSLLNYIVAKYSDKVAFTYYNGETWINKTYADFNNDVTNTAKLLKQFKCERKKIYIKQLNSYDWFVDFFAIIISNNISVVLNPELSEDEFKKDNAFLNIDYIISSLYFNQISCRTEYRDKSIPRNCAVIIKTSGTTDSPKYVMLSQKNIISSLLNEISRINLKSNGKSLAVLPLWHLYEICLEILFNLVTCNTTIFNNKKEDFLSNLKRFKPDHLFIVPSLVKLISLIYSTPNQANVTIKDNLKIIFCGSAALSKELVLFFQKQGVILVQGYGSTECSPLVAVQELNNIVVGTVGKEGICNKIRIKNEEIQVKGKNVMLGYYKNRNATKSVFDGKWYKTGDLGVLDKDKNLIVRGRKNSLIVLSNGEKFYPEEIEEAILNNPKIDYCKIIYREQKLYAEVFSNLLTEPEILDYIKAVNSNLSLNKRISDIKILEIQPQKTDLGKTYRK